MLPNLYNLWYTMDKVIPEFTHSFTNFNTNHIGILMTNLPRLTGAQNTNSANSKYDFTVLQYISLINHFVFNNVDVIDF